MELMSLKGSNLKVVHVEEKIEEKDNLLTC
jgi:hypothetical protein